MRRRTFTQSMGVLGMVTLSPFTFSSSNMLKRTIPSSGEKIPVIGMGSWLTFDVAGNSTKMENMKQVLSTFFKKGGRVIDSSPMYGSSEKVIGELSKSLSIEDQLWVSTKVWTNGMQSGIRQIEASSRYFSQQVKVNHVHNMRDFKIHYKTLQDYKQKGLLKYVGITHYLNSAHDDLERLIKNYDLDFIQFNYNIDNPNAEKRLLSIAAENKVAVIINRPFKAGYLFTRVEKEKLPEWAKEMGINSWATYFLKFIISHPAVTCAIPATTQVSHVIENMDAAVGYLPNSGERKKMYEYYRIL